MFHAMGRITLILLLQLWMLARGLIISRRFVQLRAAPKHQSTHISNYQSSEHKSNQHDESDQMKFPCTLKNALLIIRDYCYLLITNYLAIKLLVTYNFSACRKYLAGNHLSFPCAPCWVRHSYLSKGLQQTTYTCGSSSCCYKISYGKNMLNLDSLGGFSCYKTLTYISSIEKELRTPQLITCLGQKILLMTHYLLMIAFLMNNQLS